MNLTAMLAHVSLLSSLQDELSSNASRSAGHQTELLSMQSHLTAAMANVAAIEGLKVRGLDPQLWKLTRDRRR